MIRCIQRQETDPYYNLAAEEHLFNTATSDTFVIWRNEPSVIVGKHQNLAREINHSYCESHNLPVVRRISGGGTVYHDLGNINFSFIYTSRKENPIDYVFFTRPVISFLKEMGLDAVFYGKNSINIEGCKVSGNSSHLRKSKVLHHGTLLFQSDLEAMHRALESNESFYRDRSVRSERALVANIHDHLKTKINTNDFMDLFLDFIGKHYAGAIPGEISKDDHEAILKLTGEKYSKDSWNYGYSPDYAFQSEWEMQDGKYKLVMMVSNGIIQDLNLSGPKNYNPFLKNISDHVRGTLHESKSLKRKLGEIHLSTERERNLLNLLLNNLF